MKDLYLRTITYIKNNNEKVIVGILSAIFLAVSVGAFWDLYGKNMFTSKTVLTSTPSISAVTPQPTVPTNNQTQQNTNGKSNKPPKDQQVDTTQFNSCMTGLTTKKACKDCCDGLGLDAVINDTCRKTCNRSISQ